MTIEEIHRAVYLAHMKLVDAGEWVTMDTIEALAISLANIQAHLEEHSTDNEHALRALTEVVEAEADLRKSLLTMRSYNLGKASSSMLAAQRSLMLAKEPYEEE